MKSVNVHHNILTQRQGGLMGIFWGRLPVNFVIRELILLPLYLKYLKHVFVLYGIYPYTKYPSTLYPSASSYPYP